MCTEIQVRSLQKEINHDFTYFFKIILSIIACLFFGPQDMLYKLQKMAGILLNA